MKLNLSSKLLAGALVLAASGSVFANTNLVDGQTGNSSLFLNVVDLTAGTDYVLDLSAIDASNRFKTFNAAAGQTIGLGSDANWTAFKATTGAMRFSSTWSASTRRPPTQTPAAFLRLV